MRLELRGRHVDLTLSLREMIDSKLERLERYLSERAISTQVVLTRERERHRVDITLHARGEKFLHGVGDAAIWETSVSEAVEKIVQQAKKIKGKWEDRKRQATRTSAAGVDGNGNAAATPARRKPAPKPTAKTLRALRASKQAVKPMSVIDAAKELDAGDGLVIFRDPATQVINVLYRRRDGELTLIEAEA